MSLKDSQKEPHHVPDATANLYLEKKKEDNNNKSFHKKTLLLKVSMKQWWCSLKGCKILERENLKKKCIWSQRTEFFPLRYIKTMSLEAI